ncbi:MAG: hypothetical protein AAFQ98_18195, partial [Bacteroidota bacterium]
MEVEPEETEIPCVFNSDFYTQTLEWAADLGIPLLFWDEQEGFAVANLDGDTLRLKKGGCNHLVWYAEVRFYGSDESLERDVEQWVQEGIELAQIVSFSEYKRSLEKGEYTVVDQPIIILEIRVNNDSIRLFFYHRILPLLQTPF